VEDHLTLNSEILGLGLQLIAVPVPLACLHVRISRAGDDVNSIASPCEYARHGVNNVHKSLVGRKQAESERTPSMNVCESLSTKTTRPYGYQGRSDKVAFKASLVVRTIRKSAAPMPAHIFEDLPTTCVIDPMSDSLPPLQSTGIRARM
jgi:hypothetical protein